MKTVSLMPWPALPALALLALALATGCDDDADGGNDVPDAAPSADAGPTPDGATPDAGGAEVVGISIRVRNPEGRNIYLGAFPEVPSGELARDGMVELADNDIDFHDGYAYDFSRETGAITRYSVDDTLAMVEGPSLSLANLGLNGARGMAFVDDTRAYSYGTTGAALVVAVFDPTAMEITGTLPADAIANDDYPTGIVSKAEDFGDHIVFAVDWSDRNNLRINPKAVVAFIPKAGDEPVFIAEDDRCAGAYRLFVDAAGDLYVFGTSGGGYFRLYGQEPAELAPSCALRIKAGETTFDPDFYLDLEAATGTETVYGVWYIADHRVLVLGLHDTGALPAPENYLTEATFDPYMVDLDTGASTLIAGIPPAMGMSWREHRIDGTLYYQSYTSVTGTASVDIYRVDADGTATLAFSTLGDPWTLGTLRIR